jgi:rhodanese-related sulfurtransferase
MQEQQQPTCFAMEDLKVMLKQASPQITIIDVRNTDEYAVLHIPGAINIPLSELEQRSGELSKDRTIITACGKGGGRSAQAAKLLRQMGFTTVNYLCGGSFGWFESN